MRGKLDLAHPVFDICYLVSHISYLISHISLLYLRTLIPSPVLFLRLHGPPSDPVQKEKSQSALFQGLLDRHQRHRAESIGPRQDVRTWLPRVIRLIDGGGSPLNPRLARLIWLGGCWLVAVGFGVPRWGMNALKPNFKCLNCPRKVSHGGFVRQDKVAVQTRSPRHDRGFTTRCLDC